METKSALRTRMAAIREAIPAEQRETKSAAIARRLAEWPPFVGAHTVLTFLSTRSEVATARIITTARQQGKCVAAPRTLLGERRLDFRELRGRPAELVIGPYGIIEPALAAPAVAPAAAAVILVPGLAFDPQGYRLGYGGGFYDRLLALTPGVTVGLAFAEQMVEHVPHAPHDRPVQWIVTDQRILRCGDGKTNDEQ